MKVRRWIAVALAASSLGTIDACDGNLLGISERTLTPNVVCNSDGCHCIEGFDDCDGNSKNGCEADLGRPETCGACTSRCDNGTCNQGACSCDDGHGDCDGKKENGCEADLGRPETCGACTSRCDNGTCNQRACGCFAAYDDCNHDAKDGCEAPLETDTKNCGQCGHDCLGAACKGGKCQPRDILTLGPEPRYSLALFCGHGNVYIASCVVAQSAPGTSVRIEKIPSGGGAVATVFEAEASQCPSHPWRFDGERAYWVDNTTLQSVSLRGIPVHKVILDPIVNPLEILGAGGGYVYWVESGPDFYWRLSRVDVTKGTVESNLFTTPAQLESVVYPLTVDAQGVSLAPAESNQFVAKRSILFRSHQGSIKTLLPPTTMNVLHLTTNDDYVLWSMSNTQSDANSIKAIPIGGGGTSVVVPGYHALHTSPFVADKKSVYYFDSKTQSLHKARIDGSAIDSLATNIPSEAEPLAVDEKAVYWIEKRDQHVILRAVAQ